MQRVLIITYYWPPSGGSGVQRWLKFAKYLPLFNWAPVVFTVENGEYPAKDESLAGDVTKHVEVIRNSIWEPYSLYKIFTNQKQKKVSIAFMSDKIRPSLAEKISVWLRGNLFIPDARVFWIRPSVNYLLNYLKSNPVDVIVSSGPPHSSHLIAKKIKEKTGLKWIADFRDPWTGVYYFDDLRLTSFAKTLHRKLEKNVLNTADEIIVVGETMKQEFEALSNTPVHVITNGYDEDEYPSTALPLFEKFTISTIGLFSKTQNNNTLWAAISQLINDDADFAKSIQINFVGQVDGVAKNAIRKAGISEVCNFIDYVPHNKVVEFQKKSHVLLLAINRVKKPEHLLTGKLFEYLGARRPILCVGPVKGDAAAIVNETNSGCVVDFDDIEKIKSILLNYFRNYQNKTETFEPLSTQKYSRKSLTEKLAKQLNRVAAQ